MVDIILKNLTKAPNEEGFLTFMVLSDEEWEHVQNHFQAIKRDGFTDDLLNYGYTKGYRKGSADAVDEFVKKLTSDEFQKYDIDCVFETSLFGTYSECIDVFIEYVNAIAEQLKEQKRRRYAD